ncbi:unnamed protein product [Chrysoparadoxa australica]
MQKDFELIFSADQMEVGKLKSKKASLELEIAAFDVVHDDNSLLKTRQTKLEKQANEEADTNSQELSAMRGDMLKMSNKLEEVFRNTLGELDLHYQRQASTTLNTQADKASEEISHLSMVLSLQTAALLRLMEKQKGSTAELASARIEKEVVSECSELLEKRVNVLRKSAAKQELRLREMESAHEQAARQLHELRVASPQLRRLNEELQALMIQHSDVYKAALSARKEALTTLGCICERPSSSFSSNRGASPASPPLPQSIATSPAKSNRKVLKGHKLKGSRSAQVLPSKGSEPACTSSGKTSYDDDSVWRASRAIAPAASRPGVLLEGLAGVPAVPVGFERMHHSASLAALQEQGRAIS